jgi:hypothetical protein
MKEYFNNLGGALSQFLNALFLNGDNNYSISADAYRLKRKNFERVINLLFSAIESDHCYKSYKLDLEKAEKLVREAAASET